MNKKTLIIILAVLLVLVVLWLLSGLFRGIMGTSSTKAPKKNEPDIEARVDWQQKQMAVNVFTTPEDPEGQTVEDKTAVHISFMSFFAVSLNNGQKLKDFSVTVQKFTQGKGTQVVYQTPHIKVDSLRSYLYKTGGVQDKAKDIVSSGKSIKLTPVEEQAQYFDQLPNYGGIPTFSLFSKQIGEYSQLAITKRDGEYDMSKVLSYIDAKAEDLNGEIILDFSLTFEDGKKYVKRMKGAIDGSKISIIQTYVIDFVEVQ